MMILNNRDNFFCFFFFPICCVTFVRLHAVFGHGRENDLVFCGLKTFGTHFCKRLQIDDLDFLFMRLSWLVLVLMRLFYFYVYSCDSQSEFQSKLKKS